MFITDPDSFFFFRSAKSSKTGSQRNLDLRARLNITVAAYNLKGKLLYVDEAASANLFQMCNGSFIEFDAAFNFATRYDEKIRSSFRKKNYNP